MLIINTKGDLYNFDKASVIKKDGMLQEDGEWLPAVIGVFDWGETIIETYSTEGKVDVVIDKIRHAYCTKEIFFYLPDDDKVSEWGVDESDDIEVEIVEEKGDDDK